MNSTDHQILTLAIPSIVTNVTVPLLGLSDIAIAGHIGGAVYIGAVSAGSMIFNTLYWPFVFLRMGTSGLTAQALGRRALGDVAHMSVRALAMGLAFAALFLFMRTPLLEAALALMQPSTEIRQQITLYFNICIWGAPAVMGLYALSGWFVGMQNTRFPMRVSLFQNILNIMVSLYLVFGHDMRIEGIAWGTLIAQWGGMIFAILLWLTTYGRIGKYLTEAPTIGWRSFLCVHRDIFFRTILLVAVNLAFTAAGSWQGEMILAANTLLMIFFTIFSYVMDGFAFAAEALCGRCYGARQLQTFWYTCRCLGKWGVAMAILFTFVYWIGGSRFLIWMTNDMTVIGIAKCYLPWAIMIPFAGTVAFVLDGIFIGITATRGMLVSTAVSTAVFFLLWILLKEEYGNHALWIAFIVYLGLRGVVQILWMKRI